jgi:outer membrane protein OmpA-like peptidoglycan-associated protein
LKKKRQQIQEGGSKVPVYIVTFSDMVTLLLTFFVMLLSLADVQDPELFNRGRDSFWESVRYCGLGMLFGKKMTASFGDIKTKHLISDPNNTSENRGIDEQRERIRRLFEKINRSMTALPSQLVAERVNFSVTNIHFSEGQTVLDESAKRFLVEFCLNIQQNTDIKVGTLYILGLAGDIANGKHQWIISAKRAQTVAEFIKDTLSDDMVSQIHSETFKQSLKWNIFWWGAGTGGDWIGKDDLISKKSHILIALLRTPQS